MKFWQILPLQPNKKTSPAHGISWAVLIISGVIWSATDNTHTQKVSEGVMMASTIVIVCHWIVWGVKRLFK